ncbi:MAG: U32 family peptidase [Bacteroidaceae bacterium]|nr:U32 family peptidase [Bacteroidaceae bacterium]
MTSIELLAPARDLETARQAILHGADAVYIGAERFGARAGAGNSLDDIRTLCREAHQFGVKVDVTLNTILYDDELEQTRQLAWDLYEAGVDALIIQDLALLKMDLPPIALHASTQMDNRTPEKVEWLYGQGFEQIVLARELTLEQIREIHQRVPEACLEVFVHGSICVCFNGQCYASQHLFNRSANRGECAQFCRMPFDLVDSGGNVLQRQRYLLSMRDMNRSAELEQLLDCGARSLKIEGRLKDIPYVKNVVAYYRQLLDDIMRRRPEYVRSSRGSHTFSFQPRLEAAFNRGFTNYFLNGRTQDLCNPITPKSVGEPVGFVKTIRRDHIVVAGSAAFNNGDGLCFFDDDQRLQGFRVNRADGNHLYVRQLPTSLHQGMQLYRNQNMQFDAEMARPTATRKMPLYWTLCESSNGFRLQAQVEGWEIVSLSFEYAKELARTPQKENIVRQLSRLGDTPFDCAGVDIRLSDTWFLPSSILADWRKQVLASLSDAQEKARKIAGKDNRQPADCVRESSALSPFIKGNHITYRGNVANHLAREFYLAKGAKQVDWALERKDLASLSPQPASLMLMNCKYCIMNQLGNCLKEHKAPGVMPLYLRLSDGRRFRLQFDCAKCEMNVYATD